MTVTVRESADGDRVWVDVDGAPRAFVRMRALEELVAAGTDFTKAVEAMRQGGVVLLNPEQHEVERQWAPRLRSRW